MWRDPKNNSRPGVFKINNNRWRLLVAFIFLLAGALLYQLFKVQIKECDMYTALAANQQNVDRELMPTRGKIYVTEEVNGQEKLYPLATNKDLAVLYVVPKDMVNPTLMADRFFEFLDKPNLAKSDQSRAPVNPAPVIGTSTSATGSSLVPTSTSAAAIASSTRDTYMAAYLKKFTKPNSLYQPIDGRYDGDTLLKFYAFLSNALATSTPQITSDDLTLLNERVVYKNNTSTELVIPGVGYNFNQYRYYPDNEVGAHLLGFVSYADPSSPGIGKYGLEEFFNDDLTGKAGSVKSAKGANGATIIADDRQYVEAENGSDLVLTVDRNVEYYACVKLKEAVKKHGADGGSVIVMNPKSGAIIAMCSVPDFDPNNYSVVKDIAVFNNPAIFNQYEPGSVYKTITMSAAIDQGKVSPSTTYKDTGEIMIPGWPKPIKNSDFSTHGPHGVVDMNTVLEFSLNLGAIFAERQVGSKVFADYVKNYGFGEKTGIEVGSENSGNIGSLLGNKVKEIEAATASFGQGISVTALQMIMPYQAVANHGILMKPYIVKAIVHPDGSQEDISPQSVRQVITAQTANTISAMLVNVVESGHAKGSQIQGYYIGGKTGTAQVATAGGYSATNYIHTFVGIIPIDNPAFVMLTKMDNPKDANFAESTVVPLWRDIADFMLKYYQVPATRPLK